MSANEDVKRIVRYFKNREEVSAIYLFGSFVENRKMPESDIDIAVLIDKKYQSKKNLGVLKNDYYQASPAFSIRSVDIVILNTASPYLKHHILKTGKILFDRNRELRVRFTAKTIVEYLDFKPIEDIFNKTIANRFRRTILGR